MTRRLPGKRIGGFHYIHRSVVPTLPPPFSERVTEALAIVGHDVTWNVVKFDAKNAQRLSLLDYDAFETSPFPALKQSHLVDVEAKSCRTRSFNRDNPPILHRKELLLAEDHPDRERFASLTRELERRGLFEDMATMGFARPWAQRLDKARIGIEGHDVRERPAVLDAPAPVDVHRHKTAIVRNRLSTPMQALHRHGLITAETTVLDYGCGQGDDVSVLIEAGIDAVGWDPHHAPDALKRPSAIVNLGFVLNVIEDLAERRETLRAAFACTRGCLAVAVMNIGKADTTGLTPYRDGYLTRRRTFQKYFEQDELRRFIAESLQIEPIAVAPGLFFAFKDEVLEQRFLLQRQRRRPLPGIVLEPVSPRPSRATPRQPSLDERLGDLIEALAEKIAALGRLPDKADLAADLAMRVANAKASFDRLLKRAVARVDPQALSLAQAAHRDDLTVYFALNAFNRKQRYGSLPPELQRDVRAFFGSHQNAIAAGEDLLFAIADRNRLESDAEAAFDGEIGWLEDDAYFVHRDDIERLSPLLRTYIGVGQRLAGSLEDAQVFKIHLRSSKLTALDYAGFDDHPLPRLRQRLKIDLRRQRVEVFDYARSDMVQLLYLKSRLLPRHHAQRALQEAFDRQLLGSDLGDFSGFGPSFEDFTSALRRHGLAIEGHRIIKHTALRAHQA